MPLEESSCAVKTVRENRLQTANRVAAERRVRVEHFLDRDLFGEPAWDVLLYLFQCQSSGKGAKIEGAALAAGLPVTSALRLLESLEGKGLAFAYREEEANARKVYLRLSSKGYQNMAHYLDRVAQRVPIQASSENGATLPSQMAQRG